jgi:hypothetical protein
MSDIVRIRSHFTSFPPLTPPHAPSVRFIEAGRIRWISSIGEELGGQAQVDAFLRAQGVSFILKSININFRKPVQYPDTVSSDPLRPLDIDCNSLT